MVGDYLRDLPLELMRAHVSNFKVLILCVKLRISVGCSVPMYFVITSIALHTLVKLSSISMYLQLMPVQPSDSIATKT